MRVKRVSPKRTSRFGRFLVQLRDQRRLSIVRLSALMADRWSPSAISKYEKGQRTPSAEFVVQVGRALNLSETEQRGLLTALIVDTTDRVIREYEDALETVTEQAKEDPYL